MELGEVKRLRLFLESVKKTFRVLRYHATEMIQPEKVHNRLIRPSHHSTIFIDAILTLYCWLMASLILSITSSVTLGAGGGVLGVTDRQMLNPSGRVTLSFNLRSAVA